MSKTLVQLSPVSKGGKLASTSARGHLSGKIVHAVLGDEVSGFWGYACSMWRYAWEAWLRMDF